MHGKTTERNVSEDGSQAAKKQTRKREGESASKRFYETEETSPSSRTSENPTRNFAEGSGIY